MRQLSFNRENTKNQTQWSLVMNLVERFIPYTKVNTTTNRENDAAGIIPSSEGQRILALQLVEELKALGVEDIKIRDTAIVTATLPSNLGYDIPTVAFFGHLGTSVEQVNKKKAQVIPYKGGYLYLNK